MNLKLKIAGFAIFTLLLASCNSNKKSVEADGTDLSNLKRVGTVDTMQNKEVLPGNIASIDEYVRTIQKGMRADLKDFQNDPKYKSIALGGKNNSIIQTNITYSNFEMNSLKVIFKDDHIIYAESRTSGKDGMDIYKYYFEGDKITTTLKSIVDKSGDDRGKMNMRFEKIDNIPGRDAQIISLEKEAKDKFLSQPPYKCKVSRDGEGFKAVTCYNGLELKVIDPNGFIVKSFRDHDLGENYKLQFIMITGNINEKEGKISVSNITYQGMGAADADCF